MSRYAMCPVCGRRMRRDYNDWGVWDGASYICDRCASDVDDLDEDVLSVDDAALIWASNGKDEDEMFGYSREELEETL